MRYKNAQILTCLQLKHLGVHLHGLDTRDTYTNLIKNELFLAQNESYQITYMLLIQ